MGVNQTRQDKLPVEVDGRLAASWGIAASTATMRPCLPMAMSSRSGRSRPGRTTRPLERRSETLFKEKILYRRSLLRELIDIIVLRLRAMALRFFGRVKSRHPGSVWRLQLETNKSTRPASPNHTQFVACGVGGRKPASRVNAFGLKRERE